MKEKDKKLFPSVLLSVLLVVLTGGAVSVCSYFYIRNEYQMVRNVSMAVMGTLIVLNVFWVSAEKEKLDYQKEYGVHFVNSSEYSFKEVNKWKTLLVPWLPS